MVACKRIKTHPMNINEVTGTFSTNKFETTTIGFNKEM